MLSDFKTMPQNGYLYFSAPWCVPCKRMHPILDALPVEILEIDADLSHKLAAQLGVSSLPTIIKIVDGKPVAWLRGGKSPQEVREFVK